MYCFRPRIFFSREYIVAHFVLCGPTFETPHAGCFILKLQGQASQFVCQLSDLRMMLGQASKRTPLKRHEETAK